MLHTIKATLMLFLLMSVSAGSWAAGSLAVSQYVVLEVPAEKAWNKVKNFNALDEWHPAVAKTEILAGENNAAGAVRLLTLQDGGTIREKLHNWDSAEMTFTYSIIEGVLPVSDYEATITVDALTDTSSKVTWTGSFNAGKGADDKTAVDTINSVYQAGLENLKNTGTKQ